MLERLERLLATVVAVSIAVRRAKAARQRPDGARAFTGTGTAAPSVRSSDPPVRSAGGAGVEGARTPRMDGVGRGRMGTCSPVVRSRTTGVGAGLPVPRATCPYTVSAISDARAKRHQNPHASARAITSHDLKYARSSRNLRCRAEDSLAHV
ncbi:MAG: hypothetical protein MJD61_19145 [Proteobacteria bacterium]|nr:hypothetical protein [Pseudomonadota bacterium]